jgi:hypothetical protein
MNTIAHASPVAGRRAVLKEPCNIEYGVDFNLLLSRGGTGRHLKLSALSQKY